MKKFFALFVSVIIVVSALFLASCGGDEPNIGGDPNSRDTAVPEDAGSLKIGVKEDDGKVITVGVDEDKELASYVIFCPADASDAVKATAEQIKADVEKKTEASLPISNDGERQIVLAIDSQMGESDYSVSAEGGKMKL
ncbi:MAG: hypothetical protein E7671_04080 [Ruminococcaceae bacterium]|nr:hypothetical protein [Oscillospiraceae bacterium]